jgi:hypothetical protein
LNPAVVDRGVEDHGDAVAVLPFDPVRRTALLVRILRAPAFLSAGRPELLECPAGIMEEPIRRRPRRENTRLSAARTGWLRSVRPRSLQSLLGPLGQALIAIRDLKRRAFGFGIGHLVGMQASFSGAIAPMLSLALANFEQAHRLRGTRNIGSFSTIS